MSTCAAVRTLFVRAVEGELDPSDALTLAAHLDGCTACRIVLARERRLAAALDGLGDHVQVDDSFVDAVMASLPERPALSRRERWRRGLRLAGLSSLAVAGGGIAARFLPFLRIDFAAPAMPRFAPEDTSGWLTLFGSAAQWVRVTAESLAWSGPSGSLGLRLAAAATLDVLLLAAAVMLASSVAVAWRRRATSPPS